MKERLVDKAEYRRALRRLLDGAEKKRLQLDSVVVEQAKAYEKRSVLDGLEVKLEAFQQLALDAKAAEATKMAAKEADKAKLEKVVKEK